MNRKLLHVEKDVYFAQAKTCVGLIMIGCTAVFVLPGWRKQDDRLLFRWRIGRDPRDVKPR